MPIEVDLIVKLLTMIMAGFIGAYSAFYMRKIEYEEKKVEERKSQLNKAIFVLIRMINAVQNVKRDLSRYENVIEMALNLPAYKPPEYDDVKFDITGLSFLIDFDEPNVLMALTIEQERFFQAMNAIEIRNDFYVKEFQPEMHNKALNNKSFSIDDLKKTLGDRLFNGAVNGVETIQDLVYSCDEKAPQLLEDLSLVFKKLYPNEKHLKWKPN